MAEMAHAGQDHGQAGLVGGGDDLRVAHGAAGLDHRRGAGLRRRQRLWGDVVRTCGGCRLEIGIGLG